MSWEWWVFHENSDRSGLKADFFESKLTKRQIFFRLAQWERVNESFCVWALSWWIILFNIPFFEANYKLREYEEWEEEEEWEIWVLIFFGEILICHSSFVFLWSFKDLLKIFLVMMRFEEMAQEEREERFEMRRWEKLNEKVLKNPILYENEDENERDFDFFNEKMSWKNDWEMRKEEFLPDFWNWERSFSSLFSLFPFFPFICFIYFFIYFFSFIFFLSFFFPFIAWLVSVSPTFYDA